MNVNWWLALVAFVLGAGFTYLWMIRTVTRNVPVRREQPAPAAGGPVGLAAAVARPDEGSDDTARIDKEAIAAVAAARAAVPPAETSAWAAPVPAEATDAAEPPTTAVQETPVPAEATDAAEPPTTAAQETPAGEATVEGTNVGAEATTAELAIAAAPRTPTRAMENASPTSADASDAARAIESPSPVSAVTPAPDEATRAIESETHAPVAPDDAGPRRAVGDDPADVSSAVAEVGAEAGLGAAAAGLGAVSGGSEDVDASGPHGSIKGNADSMLYHAPESPWYGSTKAEEWFATEAEAEAAGYTRWDRRAKADAAAAKVQLAEENEPEIEVTSPTIPAVTAIGQPAPAGDIPTAPSEPVEAEPALPPGPYGPGSAAPAADGSGPAGWTIKGNADSMLFHSPGSPWYARTKAEVWFRTEEAAKAAGFLHWNPYER